MTYRLLRQDCREDFWSAMYVEGVDIDALKLGRPMADVVEPLTVMLSAAGEEPRDFFELPCLIVSNAMRGVLERAGLDNIQYFKAELHVDWSIRVHYGFWVANVMGIVSCIDLKASTFESRGNGELGDPLSLQIDPARTFGLGLFRLAEDRRLIVVSPRIQAALHAAKLSGLIVQDPETYDGTLVRTPAPPEWAAYRAFSP